MRPAHPCAVSSCPVLVIGRARCPEHTTERKKDPAQQKHYNSARWQEIRGIVRRTQPICMKCKRRPSTQVHHVDNDWRNNDLANLEAWCTQCHTEHSGREHKRKQANA